MLTFFVFLLMAVCPHLISSAGSFVNKEISASTTQFSVALLKTITKDTGTPGNLVISPVSVYSLLAIVQQGAGGKSRQEIDTVLHISSNKSRDGYKNLTISIEESDSTPSLRFMCKARIKGNHNFVPEFKQALIQDFKSKFFNKKRARGRLNSVNKSRSSDLLKASGGALTKVVIRNRNASKTSIALANQLYFKGHWAHMGVSDTSILFSPAPGEVLQTEAMQMKKVSFTGVSPEVGAKWIHLPLAIRKKIKCCVRPSGNYWSRRSVSLMVVLPTERHGLDTLMQRLTPEHLIKFINYSIKDRKSIDLFLPKFRVNTTAHFVPHLKKLGLQDVFQKSSNLSGILSQQQMFVSKALQTGQITIDSEGVRTSSESDAGMPFPYAFFEASGDLEPFVINEPFLFFVVDKANALPLFAGKITRPEPPPASDN